MTARTWATRALGLLATAVVVTPLVAVGGGVTAPVMARETTGTPAYQETRTITRTQLVDGVAQVVDQRDVTVTVDRTTELRGRERVRVSWAGAHPSGGRAANPYGETGLMQEYPVVILQCRGVDDPSLPAAQQLRPETCWTSTRQQRTISADESAAPWRHDLYATDAQRGPKTGVVPFPAPEACNDASVLSTHVTPFVAADGTSFLSCTAETMAPEAAVGATYPPSEIAAYTDLDGNGETGFEVRTDIENESLGCGDKVACSIVVIPIMGISCVDSDPICNKYGRFAPGSNNFVNEGIDDAVGPALWWSPSNWRNRFSVPLEFGLPPDACDVLDDRAPTGFFGSELMSQAALQWAPAYCLDKDRFKFQHNRMGDEPAFLLMENGEAAAAFVSGPRENLGTDPVAYAPTAVTGFAVSYVIDKPENTGEYTDLRLNARLLAKLLTQSYPGSALGAQHPGMESNPWSMNLDPEFQQLNPGLDTTAREAAATVLSLSQTSDVMSTLTAYIAQDKDAMAFVKGKADPWGMKVNPSYQDISLPIAEWPMLDTFVPASELECLVQNPAVYLSQVAAPVSYLRTIAEAVLDAWPNVQTKCDKPTMTDPFKLGRIDRQGIGTRFMLGITSLGDAARLGLRTAALHTGGGTYVGPGDASLSAAVKVAEPTAPLQPFELSQAALARMPRAYPATMIVYTAARTANLDEAEAAKVALFLDVALGEGQKRGYENGELPPGYLPITASGTTKALHDSAVAAARAIADQTGVTDEENPAKGNGGEGAPKPAGPSSSSGGAAPVLPEPAEDDVPAAKSGTTKVPKPEKALESVVVETAPVATAPQVSRVGQGLLPLALFVGLFAGVVSTGARVSGRLGRRAGR